MRYSLTPIGLKLGVLLVKLRLRLLGPLTSLIRQPRTSTPPRRFHSVDADYREVVGAQRARVATCSAVPLTEQIPLADR